MKKAILMGPFVGELYWECGRFAPMLPYYKKKRYKGQDIKYIVLTREERFDLYGNHADILVPLRIEGDYTRMSPNCFKLNGLKMRKYLEIADKFRSNYEDRFEILHHEYPNVTKGLYVNKNQYNRNRMMFSYKPRQENYNLVEEYLPNDNKPLVVLAPRFRRGFKRNWKRWQEFYNLLDKDSVLMNEFNFIICGKEGEYKPDVNKRFLDMNDIIIGKKSSLVGVLLVIMSKACFTFGSQSAIPNISLLYGVEVLEFGCQKSLHTRTYNVKNTPITFIENRK